MVFPQKPVRHGRACPGHPRLASCKDKKGVDARHKAGHDENIDARAEC
jgi:hypothetical protein